jgi:hypothetical protein
MPTNDEITVVLEQCVLGYVGTWKIKWQALMRGRDDDLEPDEYNIEDYQQCLSGTGSDFDDIREIVGILLDRGHIELFSCLEPDGQLTPVEPREEVNRILKEDGPWKNEPKPGVVSYYFGSTPEGDAAFEKEWG